MTLLNNVTISSYLANVETKYAATLDNENISLHLGTKTEDTGLTTQSPDGGISNIQSDGGIQK